MKFQIEGAKAFKEGGGLKLLMQKHCDTLMEMACTYIKNNIDISVDEEQQNEESVSVLYVHAWLDLFGELGGNISIKSLKDVAIPLVKGLIDLKNK